jgi:hypothetical protein
LGSRVDAKEENNVGFACKIRIMGDKLLIIRYIFFEKTTCYFQSRKSWLLLSLSFLFGLLLMACGETSQSTKKGAQLAAPPKGVTVVSLRRTAKGTELLRGGKPYFIKGGGGLQHLDLLQKAGANSIRLWSTDYAKPLMDEAQSRGLTVMLGLWLAPEDQHFTYYDPAMVQAQRERIRQQVLRYRNHPALLMWSVGNEVEQTSTGPRLFSAVNDIARMIHELDPYHPVTTALAHDFIDRAKELQREAPEIDILSINIYKQMPEIPYMVRLSGWKGPYIVSEYGSRGYWEIDRTDWQAPLEPSSGDKAEFIKTSYSPGILADSSRCLGGYVFYWGSKFEYTPTWLSLFEPTGEKTEVVDELYQIWSHRWPANRAPHLSQMLLAGQPAKANITLKPGHSYPVQLQVTDPEGDSLTTRWQVYPEMRTDGKIEDTATPLEPIVGYSGEGRGTHSIMRAPVQPGVYRVFVWVYDGHGSVATANVPFWVPPVGTSKQPTRPL